MVDVVAHSQAAMEKGSTSFSLASRLFGRTLREDVWHLYAWCRHCDDVIDGQDHGGASAALTPEDRQQRLETLRVQTHAALSNSRVEDPAFIGFQRVALKHDLPHAWALELLEGFAMDVDGRRYGSDADMLKYCWRVAGVVGAMMAVIMGGSRSPEVLRRAQDLGLAFQITNICRDVREDAENGRVYLPADRLIRAGIDPTPSGVRRALGGVALFGVTADLLRLSEQYYQSSRRGLRSLPFRGALAVAVAREVYRSIGRGILRKGPPAVCARARVHKGLMPLLVVRGCAVALWSRVEGLWRPRPRPGLWSSL